MIGPPGTGKSMLAKRIPTIMPPMTEEEAIETTKIHSIAGLLDRQRIASSPPAPSARPHHTISDAGLLGGATNPRPGEVSIAHHGVLFLDELPEFRRTTLEVLRQPLEDGHVTISRAAGTITFPARVHARRRHEPLPVRLLRRPQTRVPLRPAADLASTASASPARCSTASTSTSRCRRVDYRELSSDDPGEPSDAIRARVDAARTVQTARFAKHRNVGSNTAMSSRLIREHCRLDDECRALLEQAMNEMNLSARAHDRILKVSRTLADLEAAPRITANHLLEAIQYRTLDRRLWD